MAGLLLPHSLRLTPGDDLRGKLEEATRTGGWGAACVVTCVGSLARARLRRAGGKEAHEHDGPFEIVGLVGTLSPDGPHLHVALADARGRMLGGHLLHGSPVHTTAEIVIGVLEGTIFRRELDPATGWRELGIPTQD